jgi:pyruvate/2-oxoglutarate dehydrogenase complex dihydrolipoamide acyltransferase (E2) component
VPQAPPALPTPAATTPTAPPDADVLQDRRAWDGPLVIELSYPALDGALARTLDAIVSALTQFPLLNAAVSPDGLTVFDHIDLAVTLPDQRTVCIRRAELLDAGALAHHLREGEQSTGKRATTAITVVGTPGILFAEPVPRPPLVTSLSIGCPAKAVVVDEGSDGLAIRVRGSLTLTWNAAAADAAYARAFLDRVAESTRA